jgi:MoxR-like ATPase
MHRMAAASELAQRLGDGVSRVIVGNERATFAFLIALLGRGHILIEGVPGTAKTLFVRMFAALLGVDSRRIQFTPDLMPSDVVGTTIFNPKTAEFSLRRGPIFTNLLLADEINRTPPKTQSALLEAMEERQVTIDGESQPLDEFFIVCATQNPIEFEGTYPLPEAQLDRFFVRSTTGYPSAAQEKDLLARSARGFDAHHLDAAGVTQVAGRDELLAAQRQVRTIFVADALQEYIYTIVTRTRASNDLALGASPRAAIALLVAAQASAAVENRDFATPDDVKAVAPLVLAHRLIVRPEAEVEGLSASTVLERILASVDVPKGLTSAGPL